MPVVIKNPNGSYLLAGGATRVSIAKLANQNVEAIVIPAQTVISKRQEKLEAKATSFAKKHGLEKKNAEMKEKAAKLSLPEFEKWHEEDLESLENEKESDDKSFLVHMLAMYWERWLILKDKFGDSYRRAENVESFQEWKSSQVRTPSPHMSLARLRELQNNNYVSAQGVEYSEEEVDELIARKQQAIMDEPVRKKRIVKADMRPVSDDEFFETLGMRGGLHVSHEKNAIHVFDQIGDLVMIAKDGEFLSAF
jgi:hypothetical protein